MPRHTWFDDSATTLSGIANTPTFSLSNNGPMPEAVDRHLAEICHCARSGQPGALETLFLIYRPRLCHWVRRASSTCYRDDADRSIEPEDIEQEAFVVFADLLGTWSGTGSLSAYLISHFPWRLQDVVRRMGNVRQHRNPESSQTGLIADVSWLAEEATVLLEALAHDLPGRQGEILLFRIRDGLTWQETADRLGVDKRTIQRDWRVTRGVLRESFVKRGRVPE